MDPRKLQRVIVDALEDAPPTVAFTAPGRDTKVTSVEEITAEAHAADDFGVRSLELRASVNGGPERVIVLSDSTVGRRKELDASHTFFLEELTLKPGDVVSLRVFGTAEPLIGSRVVNIRVAE